MKGLVITAAAVLVTATSGQDFQCPEKFGYFEDLRQCDKYYICREGRATPTLCPDGLVFDPYSRKQIPCDHYFNIDCGDRTDLQPAQGRDDLCPRLNGFYAHPDPAVCHIFYACVDGEATEYTCSSGLWYDEYTGTCNWPKDTERKTCSNKAYALEGEVDEDTSNFECPPPPPPNEYGLVDPHPKYPNENDCGSFFVCHNNISPRKQGCEIGAVYNTVTKSCDSPENVPECKDYYSYLEGELDQADARRRK